MSGIEAAGIALAIFPILVDGISRFTEGLRSIGYWGRCRVLLEDYAGVIESQKVYYLDTLDELLSDIVGSEDEMAQLMSEPNGPAWKASQHDQQLRQRLGLSYDVYLRTLNNMVDRLQALREKLGICPSGKVCFHFLDNQDSRYPKAAPSLRVISLLICIDSLG